MKNISIYLLLFLFVGTNCGTKKNFLQAQQVTTNVTIDGDSKEWSSSGPILVEDKISYAFRNTPTDIYILVEADSRENILQITRGGLNIWWNNAGKKKKSQGLRFPMLSPDEQLMRQRLEAESDRRAPGDFSAGTMTFDNIALLNFDNVDEQQLTVQTAAELYGIEVAAGMDENNVLTIEYRLPKELIFGSKEQSKLAILFETEEMERSRIAGRNAPLGGGRGNGGPPSGGMGRPGGSRPSAVGADASFAFWQFLELSE